MDFLREQDDVGIIVADQSLYRRFYPFLGLGAGLRLVDGSEHSNGFRPTSTWVEGELIQDNHAVRLGSAVPPGDYRLLLGLYDTAEGQRLSLLDESGVAQSDVWEWGTLVVLVQAE